MILTSFDNMLKTIINDKSLMADASRFNVVRELMSIVNSVQSLASSVDGGNMNDMLIVSIKGKLIELESIITTFGSQRLASIGIMPGTQPQQMPFMPNAPMHNQNLYYPTMGQHMYGQPMGQMYAQPHMQPHMHPQSPPPMMQQQQQSQQPQPPQAQQSNQQQNSSMSIPQPPQPASPPQPALAPTPTPKSAPQPVAQPASTPQPTPAPKVEEESPPPPVKEKPAAPPPQPIDSGGESIAGFASLPGASMGGGDGGKEKAAGRDYILKLLNGETE